MIKSRVTGLFLGILVILFLSSQAFAQHETKKADGLKVTLASAAVDDIKKHPDKHPEIKMHGGPKGTHHLLIHVEDEKTEKVISDVTVKVDVHNPDGTKLSKTMEPMTINGITDFGNYFDLRDLGTYHIDVFITPEKGKVKRVTFFYERIPGH